MSVKISELPLFTGNTTGSYLVMNNSSETETFKVLRENIIGDSGTSGTSGSSGVAGSSGTSGSSGVSGSSGTSGSSGVSGTSGDSIFAQTGSVWNTTRNVGITGSFNVNGSTSITGSLQVTGSVQITGSINGNVRAMTIASNSSSFTVQADNFFTITLPNNTTTHITSAGNVIRPGQTINILVTPTGSGSFVTFPSYIKQMSGSVYLPNVSNNKDILTLVSFDSSAYYLIPTKNML